jgi:hypothetical protein
MSSTSVPLVGIADAAAATLPLLGPKKNAIAGAPIEYCLEVIEMPFSSPYSCFIAVFLDQVVDNGTTEAGIWECTPGCRTK